MSYAYVAIDKKGVCFAIHSADPEAMDGFEKELKMWRKMGADIKLLPKKEARDLFCSDIKPENKQMELF